MDTINIIKPRVKQLNNPADNIKINVFSKIVSYNDLNILREWCTSRKQTRLSAAKSFKLEMQSGSAEKVQYNVT